MSRYGQLMEWSVDIDDPKDEHRHVNHLFGLHPGHTVFSGHYSRTGKAAKVIRCIVVMVLPVGVWVGS